MTDYVSDEAARYAEQLGKKDDPFFCIFPTPLRTGPSRPPRP
jgi:hypothetical protein